MTDLTAGRRQVLQGILVTGAVGVVMGSRMAPAKPQVQLGPFSDWSEPVNLGPVVNSSFNDFHPGASSDGLSLYFTSDRPGGVGPGGAGFEELWVTRRKELGASWEPPLNLGPGINFSGSYTGVPNLTPDGRRLFFDSNRPGGCGEGDFWYAERDDPTDDFAWKSPVNLGCTINSPHTEGSPVYFEDPETGITYLHFARLDGPGGTFENPDQDFNIYSSTLGGDGAFGAGVVVRELNSPFRDTRMTIRSDGLEIILTSNRPGGVGPAKLNLNLWVSTRANTRDPWSAPVNLGRPINSGFNDRGPALSFDGRTLYFASSRPGGSGKSDLWLATRTQLP